MLDLRPPPIQDDIFDKLRSEKAFSNFVCKEFAYEAAKAALKPEYSPDLMHDAWQSYMWDIDRLDNNMPAVPDHFKRCGYLAYWLRRHSPVALWQPLKEEYEISASEKEYRNLIHNCGRAFHAFSFGYRICLFFEENKESEVKLPRPIDADYIRHIAYYMKYKSVSPHAMGLIYRSLFWA